MTWTAAIMPDDALPPDCLVGRMLRPAVDDVTWDSPKGVKMTGCRITNAEGEPIMEISFDSEPTPLPLWRVMQYAGEGAWLESSYQEGQAQAAQIEALRDWLPDMPPQQIIDQWCREYGDMDYTKVRRTMDCLRALLTEQARIARGDA